MSKENKAHTSSASSFIEMANIHYKNESDMQTYHPEIKTITSSDPYPPTTLKITRNIKGEVSAKFSVNISKISREEKNYSINRQINGSHIVSASTKND